jgi:dethiobiotin synthetase
LIIGSFNHESTPIRTIAALLRVGTKRSRSHRRSSKTILVARTIFVTGTDTGAGKTVFAASLVHVLRSGGVHALAMKPFCSGTREDVELLQSVQPGELGDEEVNPFYFREPVAPLIALRRALRDVPLKDVTAKIREVEKRCDVLVIEGSGGLLVPLGEGYTVADLIRALKGEVVIVSRNRLGTINHTLLTVDAIRRLRPKKISVVLMEQGTVDASTPTNLEILRELIAPISIVAYPFFGTNRVDLGVIQGAAKILKKVLARFQK